MVGSSGAAGFVVMTLVVLFFALYRGWYTPEVVVSYFVVGVVRQCFMYQVYHKP